MRATCSQATLRSTDVNDVKRGAGRIELPTSPTRTENHATRPCTHSTEIKKAASFKILDPGIEPGTYCVLGSRHNQLDHRSLKGILGGTRTPNLEIRSLTPYPLGHEDSTVQTALIMASEPKGASGGGRTLDLRAMNPTRCQLRHRGYRYKRGPRGNRTPDLSHPKRESCH